MAQLPPRPLSRLPLVMVGLVALFVLVAWDLELGADNLAGLGDFLDRFADPDFGAWRLYLAGLGDTLSMALWGTTLALLLGMLLAPLAARNLTPHPLAYHVARMVANFLRALPDPLLALLLVAGLQVEARMLPGVLALALHTGGFLGKLLAEYLERVDPGVLEAVTSTGAGRLQVLMFAGWPSILRETAGQTLYILDRNVRMACVLGLVGAGGIGALLYEHLGFRDYPRAAAVILMIMATVVLVDLLSGWLRGRLR